MTTMEAANYYLAQGFSIIPLKPRDKKPLITWREYQERHPTQEEIAEWFTDGKNNIGIVTGRISGLAVVDFDTEEAIGFANAHNFPFTTPIVKTGKGYHAYCRYRDGVRNFQKRDDIPGIDLRGDGGYVAAPPSIHESGVVYAWCQDRSLNDLPPAELPDWLLATKPEHKASIAELVFKGVEKGARNDALARLAGSYISKGDSLEDALSQCLAWNATCCNPPLSKKEVTTTVKSIFAAHIRKNGERSVNFNPLSLPTGAELQTWDVKIEFLVENFLPKRAITILHGPGGIGKTWLAFQLGEAVACGSPFIGYRTEQAPVFYIDFENPAPVLVDRTRALNIQRVKFWHISNTEQPPPQLDSRDVTLYDQLPAGSLVIFDTLRSSHRGDENDSKDISDVLATLKRLREKGLTLLLLHHTSKGNSQKYKGSTAILDLADHELNLCETEKKEGEQDRYYKLHTPQKSRYKTDELTLDFDLDQGGFFMVPDESEAHFKGIYSLLVDVPADLCKKTKLIERIKETGLSRNQARRLLDKGAGKYWFVESRPGEKNTVIYTLNPVCQFSTHLKGTANWQTENTAPPATGKQTLPIPNNTA